MINRLFSIPHNRQHDAKGTTGRTANCRKLQFWKGKWIIFDFLAWLHAN